MDFIVFDTYLVIAVTLIQAVCPCSEIMHYSHCYGGTCSDLDSFICDNEDLTDLPLDIPSYVTSLKISVNQLMKIKGSILSSQVTKLLRLEAFVNHLTEWPDLSFTQEAIEYIDLSDNDIKSLDFNIIKHYSMLYELRLSRNQIIEIIPFADDTLSDIPNLVTLSLDGNEIDKVPEMCSSRFDGLQYGFQLAVYNNPLECNACISWMRKCIHSINYDFLGQAICAYRGEDKIEYISHLTGAELDAVPCLWPDSENDDSSFEEWKVTEYNLNLNEHQNSDSKETTETRGRSRLHCASQCSVLDCTSFTYATDDMSCIMAHDTGEEYVKSVTI